MAKNRPSFSCSECGWDASKWVGRCAQCEAWGTMVETRPVPITSAKSLAPTSPATPITDVAMSATERSTTGVGELDRVLGGGLVPGAVILLAGEPGVGKSTLLLDVAAQVSRLNTAPVLYISGEESASQVRLRAERIGAMSPNLHLAAEADLATIIGHVESNPPSLLVVDSVQTIVDTSVDGAAGGVSQVRAVTAGLVRLAKARSLPILLVGHVTKDGSIAGPRVLEHLVDVVCQFDGERHSRLRMVRAVKNRYGPTDEVGCFELIDEGISELPDPSGLFLSDRARTVPGTCVTITLEGRRPMPVEIQSLAVAPAGPPRRTTSGVDSSRVAMTVAVLQSRLGVDLDRKDIFVSTIGGARASEPSTDLAAALSLASAVADLPLAVLSGEVG
ncbi:DNA repair protein RadA [Flaviflexus huanghaiensis]|uniref:DNA repair protein RadA n=1 Tax=Flaviflexus huanghaiensis TaxID=1111473 RepID=UPI0015FD6C55|nr:DNA repair protein RadA [Flaviflexus huanghaiensis]